MSEARKISVDPAWHDKPLDELLAIVAGFLGTQQTTDPKPKITADQLPLPTLSKDEPTTAAPSHQALEEDPREPPPAPKKPRILVVDDELLTRKLLTLLLSQAGYEVMVLEHAHEIVTAVLRIKPDLIFLDVMMPGVDGFTACSALKEHPTLRALPVIMCTAKSSKADLLKAKTSRADAYVVKPYKRATILKKLRQFLSEEQASS